MIVERTDFISVPVTDMERATRFYRDTLGLEQVSERGFPEFQLGENVSLYLIDMEQIGQQFSAPHTAHIALRVADVKSACDELVAGGGELVGIQDTGVCHMGFCKDPDGNTVILHRRYAPRD